MEKSLLDQPDFSLEYISTFLNAPDVLHFLSTHPRLVQLSKATSFWRTLIASGGVRSTEEECDRYDCAVAAKRAYLTKAYVRDLPMIEWKPCDSTPTSPSGREGHLCCILGDRLVVTGGFTGDKGVYVTDTTNEDDWVRVHPTLCQPWIHPKLLALLGHAVGDPLLKEKYRLEKVYGATLTPLDDRRALRFGGFIGGGYTDECSQLALLTLHEGGEATWQVIRALNGVLPRAYHSATLLLNRYLLVMGGMTGTGSIQGESILDTQTWTWMTDVPTTNEFKEPKPTGRHGHSVVLDDKRNRLLLFGGGSGSDLLRSGRDNAEVWELRMGTEWKTAITPAEFQLSLPWEWNLVSSNEESDDDDDSDGSAIDEDDQHQEAMVAEIENLNHMEGEIENDREPGEGERNRPNDDASDDFHSAVEGAETDSESTSLPPTLQARPIGDSDSGSDIGSSDEERVPAGHPPPPRRPLNNNGRDAPPQRHAHLRLSDAEKLCLGRCHLGFKVGPDTVILAFGSGRPSTNRVLGFNLATNKFFRPNLRGNNLPPPRFTAAGAVFGKYNSYLFVHGGFCSQEGMAIGSMCVLDLAPALQREFTAICSDPNFVPAPPVNDDDIRGRPVIRHHVAHGVGLGDAVRNMLFALGAGAHGPIRMGGRVDLNEMLGALAGRGAHVEFLENNEDDDIDLDNDEEEDDAEEMAFANVFGAEMMNQAEEED